MSQSFDSYNSVLQVLIVNYRTSVKNQMQQFSDRNVQNTKILFTLENRIAFMLCLFLFHIDYNIYANHVLIKQQCLTRDIELIIKYRVIQIPSDRSDSIFVAHLHVRLKQCSHILKNKYNTVRFLLCEQETIMGLFQNFR